MIKWKILTSQKFFTFLGLDILDVGCGSGEHSRILAGLGAKTVTAFDLSADQIKIAQNSENAAPLGIKY